MSLFNSRESGFFSGLGGASGVNGTGTQFYVPKWTSSSVIGIGTMRDKKSGADDFIDVTGFGIQTLLVNFDTKNASVSFGEPAQGGLRTTPIGLTILGDIKTTATNSNLLIYPPNYTIQSAFGNLGIGLYMDLTNANSIYKFGDYNFAYNGCYFIIQDSTERFTTYLQNTAMGININGSTLITNLGFDLQSRLLINNNVNVMRTYIGSTLYGFEVDSNFISYLGDFNNSVNVYNSTYLRVTNDSPYKIESLIYGLEQGFYVQDVSGSSLITTLGDYNFNNNNTYVTINSSLKEIFISTYYLEFTDLGTGNLLEVREDLIPSGNYLKIEIDSTPYKIELLQIPTPP